VGRVSDKPFPSSDFHPLLLDLGQEMFEAGISEALLSYISFYLKLFFDNIYPIYPVVYRPAIERGIEELSSPLG
jgi:hypothetical protein